MLLVLCILLSATAAECALNISSTDSPSTITCNVSKDLTGLSRLDSITISKIHGLRFALEPLASINSSQVVSKSYKFDRLQAWGQVEKGPQPEEDSYLTVSFMPYAFPEQAGEYVCEAHGLDESGLPTRQQVKANVTFGFCFDHDLSEKIKELERIVSAGQTAPADESLLKLLREIVVLITYRDPRFTGVTDILQFNTSSFYIITSQLQFDSRWITFDNIAKLCKDYFGYLGEINSEVEFQFIEHVLKTMPEVKARDYFYHVMTGGYYQTNLKKFSLATHPGDPVFPGVLANQFYIGKEPNADQLMFEWTSQDGWLLQTGLERRTNRAFLCEVSNNYIDLFGPDFRLPSPYKVCTKHKH